MKLLTCKCGVECTTENVTFLPIVADCIGSQVYFNCACKSTVMLPETHENYFAVLDQLIFKEMDRRPADPCEALMETRYDNEPGE